ncbi:MAG: sugar kinase [Klebsiella huaxiensis]|uniref:sugar kinase n=1 Tax=Klebsiella huaxiensis TaxID=2153354 RepID=UPI0026EEFA27|nr:sugar kinase [Klebsiella huaxiensis]WEJ87823.1 MAG: sugar kinase [Klebsiella huaxiensis]
MALTICTLGELLVEFLSRNPQQKFTRPGEFIGPFPSGAPAIFAAQVAKLQHRAIIFGCVGNDDFGRLNIERLRHEGVIVDGIHTMNNAVTGTAFVSYHSPQERDFIFNIPDSACGLFTDKHIDRELLRQCGHIHIMGSSLFSFRMIDATRKAMMAIKASGGTVSFDPNIRKEMLNIPEMEQAFDYLIEYTDIFLPSESELPFFSRHKNLKEEQIISDLLSAGVKHVVVKRAQNGASYNRLENGKLQTLHLPGYSVNNVDPTGAGDCFGATFVTLFLAGVPPETALNYANASGALAVMQQGPMEGISSLGEIEDFLRSQR